MRFRAICLVAALLLCASLLSSKSVDRTLNRGGADPAAYRVVVPPFASAPKIDGKLDDPFWENAAILENFTQYEPVEGIEPTERTVAYIGYDKNNLYIGVRCYDSNPKAVRACLTRRDQVHGDDEVTIYLDTFNDKKRAFAFLVNPCGVQSDGIYVESTGRRRGRGRGGGGFDRIDKTWDTYFTTDARMDDEGYSVEMAIPFKSLRFPHSQPQLWGMQIKRNIRRKNEEIYWYPRSRDINGFLIQSGTIQIDGSLNKGKNFEVMPVMTGLKERGEKADPQAGMNLKYGITSDLTADGTINPDFSQVEADMPQIEVNQRYALYYPEKRPFFLEGKDYFDTPLELIYTRTIVDPAWGFKLTGKMGKTTMGVLSTYDLNATGIDIPGEESEEEEDEEDEDDIVQKGFVNIFRLKQDLFTESYIGLIFTDNEITQSGGIPTSDYNRVGGVDGHFKFWNNYRISFQVVGSQTKVGDYKSDVIPAGQLNFSARGRHLSFSANYSHIPPDFEAGSGFFRRKDVKSFNSRLGYAFLPMNDLIVDIRPSLQYRRIHDFNNVLTDEEYELSFFMSGWRGTFISAGISRNFERYEGVDFWRNNFRTWIRSEPLSWLTGGVNFSFGDSIYYDEDPYLGYKYSYGFNVTFKPITNLRLFYNFRNDTFYKSKGGELEYRVNILTQRIGYQITRHLSLRLITDYNDYNKEIYNSILLSYQLNPGTVFYVGIDDNQEQDDLGIYRVEGRFFFVKFSYWWRF
jgi:hypothetical protein